MPWIKKQLSEAGQRALLHSCRTPYPARLFELGSEWKCFWCKDHWVVVQDPQIRTLNRWERRNDALDFTKSFVNHPSNSLRSRRNSDNL